MLNLRRFLYIFEGCPVFGPITKSYKDVRYYQHIIMHFWSNVKNITYKSENKRPWVVAMFNYYSIINYYSIKLVIISKCKNISANLCSTVFVANIEKNIILLPKPFISSEANHERLTLATAVCFLKKPIIVFHWIRTRPLARIEHLLDFQ